MARKPKVKEFRLEQTARSCLDWRGLIGYDEDRSKLKSLIIEDKLPQLLLLSGREASGKRLLVAWMVALMHCENALACGECDACHAIQQSDYDELLWLETDTQYKLEDAYAIQQHMSIRAAGHSALFSQMKRVVVINDAERMNDKVANRLLKSFEEPGSQVQIILTSSRPKQLMQTILSRAVRWHLQNISSKLTKDWLLAHTPLAQKDPQLLERLLRENANAPGACLRALESYFDGQREEVEAVLRCFLHSDFSSEHLVAALSLAKDYGLSAEQLLRLLELMLNRYYRASLGLDDKLNDKAFQALPRRPSLSKIKLLRQKLSEIRRFAIKSKIPINLQLWLESLVLDKPLS